MADPKTFAAWWSGLDSQARHPDFEAVTSDRVERALSVEEPSAEDVLALLSPAARDYLEPMAQKAHAVTLARFGRTILMYAPLYLSNACCNDCAYCGFRAHNRIQRVTLSRAELLEEADAVADMGFRHVLLLTGGDERAVPRSELADICRALRERFSSLSLEVYQMDEDGYRQVVEGGADGLTLYQETYDPEVYAAVHRAGPKKDYLDRLEAPEAAGRAGMRRIGIGALLGLTDWRSETFAMFHHARSLMRRYWRTHVTISFPRLRQAEGGFEAPYDVDDAALVQMMCALRIALPDAGIIVSTRESAALRDQLLPLGVTQMSAGSRTEPGGYRHPDEAVEQFAISDQRTPEQVAKAIRKAGYDPVWKDWDPILSG